MEQRRLRHPLPFHLYVALMAENLKNLLSPSLVRELATALHRVWPALNIETFYRDATIGLEERELLDRGRQIGGALDAALPADPEGLRILIRSLGPPLSEPLAQPVSGLFYLPHSDLLIRRGPKADPDLAWEANEALTRRFTAEFSLRPLLDQDPEGSLRRLERWARHPDQHVRRAASEATRPRLPWAPRMKVFPKYVHDTLKILATLRDDPELYVRRSVANHLNDIGRDNPELLLSVCTEWRRDAPATRLALLRHALRDRLKKGDAKALALVGAEGGEGLKASGTLSQQSLQIGEKVQVEVSVFNPGAEVVQAEVDIVVHFIKANGKSAPKVFKGAQLSIEPGTEQKFRRTLSFAVHSTRQPYPGTHRLEIQVNGRLLPLGSLELRGD